MADPKSPNPYDIICLSEDLPSPRGVALRVLDAIESGTTSAAELAKIVEADPAISVRLLKAVNASVTGVSRQVASVQHAATLLGFAAVKSITLAFSLLSEHRSGSARSFDYDRFWAESLGRAVAMRHIAKRLRLMPPDDAFTYGLLSLFGRLALISVFPDRYEQVLATVAAEDSRDLEDAEAAVFEVDVEQLSARLLRSWGLPRAAAAFGLLGPADDPEEQQARERYVDLLAAAGVLARILAHSTADRARLVEFSQRGRKLGIELEELIEMFDEIADEWRAAGVDLDVHTPPIEPLSTIYTRASVARA